MSVRVWFLRAALVGTALGLVVDGSPAQERIPVEVSVELAEPSYRAGLLPEEIERFEGAAAALLADTLQDEIGYLSFVTDASSDFHLLLRLDRRDRGDEANLRSANEVGLHATLQGPGVGSETIYWMVFRPKTAFAEPLGSADDMLQELKLKLSGDDFDRLSQELLRRVPIGESAAVWEEPLGWIIPYQRSDLCVDTQSRFEIVNLVSSPAGRIERRFMAQPSADFDPPPETSIPPDLERFRHHLFSEALPDQDRLDELRRAISRQAVEVKSIYVVDYLFSHTACQDIPSPDEAFEEGGGS